MARKQNPLLTEREAEIMSVLWERGVATAEEIRSQLAGGPHDSTVRTLLRVLVTKGHVTADKKKRPTAYKPRAKQKSVRKSAAQDFVQRFFGGSAEALVLHLLEEEKLSPEEIKRLEQKFRGRAEPKESK